MRKFWWMQQGPLQAPREVDGDDLPGDDTQDNTLEDDPEEDDEGEKPRKKSKIKLDEEEVDAAEVKSALSLFRALQDEETGTEIIESMARKLGLLNKSGEPTETKKETKKELKGKVTEIFKKRLGKDYDKFTEAVAPAVEEAIMEFLEEKFGESRAESAQEKWNSEVDKFMEDNPMTPKVEKMMGRLMRESPPNSGAPTYNPQKYLSRIYKAAHEELGLEVPSKKAAPRKSSDDGDDEMPEFRTKTVSGSVSYDEAIDAAMKGIRLRKK